MRMVLTLVRKGSLAAAAKALGVNYTTVARRIAQAEARFGTRLFDRLPQGYAPTEAALEAARMAERMEEAQAQFQRHLGREDKNLSGVFTITTPQLLISSHLCRVIDGFLARHPDIDLVVHASNDLLNLHQREADLAIRISDSPGDTLMGRRLCVQETAVFASAEVAARIQQEPAAKVDWIAFTGSFKVPKAFRENRESAGARISFDDISAVMGAAQAGLGVARMPVFLGRWAGLEQVAVQPAQPYADLWAVAHRDLWSSAKVRAFKDMLLPYFKAHAADFLAAPQ